MIIEGNVSVIEAIKEKKRLMDEGEEHGHIRPLLISGGGSLKGVYAWGACRAFDDLGYGNVFYEMAGISSGALGLAYLLSGNIKSSESLISTEASSKNFFNLMDVFNVLNTPYMRTVLEGETGKGLVVENILNHQTKLMIALSDYQTAEPLILNPETAEEVYESLRATISMPGAVSANPVYIRGRRYADGESTVPYSRSLIYSQTQATHILDITNQEQDGADKSVLENLLHYTLYRFATTSNLRNAAMNRYRNRNIFLESIIEKSPVPVCLVWGDNSIGSYEADSTKLQKVSDTSYQFWKGVLS